jgi:hypothetical protein
MNSFIISYKIHRVPNFFLLFIKVAVQASVQLL